MARTLTSQTVCAINSAEMVMVNLGESSHSHSEEQVRWPEDLWKAKEEENFDTLQRWFSDSRVVVSHHCFRQSAQCLRGSLGLVRRTCPADFWSFFFQYGETCCEVEWWIGIPSLTQRCVNRNATTFDQCSSTVRLVASSLQKIRKSSRGHSSE